MTTTLSSSYQRFLRCATATLLAASLALPATAAFAAGSESASASEATVSAATSVVDTPDLVEIYTQDARFWTADAIAAYEGALPEGAGSETLSGSAASGITLLANDDAGKGDSDTEKEYNVVAPTLAVPSKAAVLAISIPTEMTYWNKYEGSYNTVKGDVGRAFGRFQFDYRYPLRDFLRFAYALDPVTFSSLKPLATDDPKNGYREDYSLWPDRRDMVADAWLECYEADPTLFSRAQDYYEWYVYYEPMRADMASLGIPIDSRHGAVKGLVWSMYNCFGSAGYHHFVGGKVYKQVDGKYQWITMPGAGLTTDMSDAEFANTLVTYLQKNILQWYPASNQTNSGTTYITRYTNELKDVVSLLPDLVKGAWYTDFVNYVKSNKFITGYSSGALDGRFGPEDRLTRAMAVTVLYRVSGEKATAVSGIFSDVSSGSWYAEAVTWAARKGIVKGIGSTGRFAPDDLVTRQDLAVMIGRFAETRNHNVSYASTAVLNSYSDKMNVSDYAKQAMAWCNNQGILTGVVKGNTTTLQPTAKCTRAQLAKMVTVLHRDVL